MIRSAPGGLRDRNRVHDPTVHEVHPLDVERRVEGRQRRGGIYGLHQWHVRTPADAEPDVLARLQVDGIDRQRNLELRPVRLRQHPRHVLPQRQSLEDRLLADAHRQQRPAVDIDDVLLHQGPRLRLQRIDFRTPGDARTDERPDAGPHDLRDLETGLPERAPRARVRRSLHATTAQNQDYPLAFHAGNLLPGRRSGNGPQPCDRPRPARAPVAPPATPHCAPGLTSLGALHRSGGCTIVEIENHYW